MYEARGFTVESMRGDMEFVSIRNSILPVRLDATARNEHVPSVERSIRSVKDRMRTIVHGLPYKSYSPLMLRSLAYFTVRLMNSFPAPNGVSDDHSPLTIVTGVPKPSYNDFLLEFGEYVQVHDNLSITNGIDARSTGAIALCPSNGRGGYHFMSLRTGSRVTRYTWTKCILTTDVIARVHDLARTDGPSDVLEIFPSSSDVDIAPEGAEPLENAQDKNDAENELDIVNEVELVDAVNNDMNDDNVITDEELSEYENESEIFNPNIDEQKEEQEEELSRNNEEPESSNEIRSVENAQEEVETKSVENIHEETERIELETNNENNENNEIEIRSAEQSKLLSLANDAITEDEDISKERNRYNLRRKIKQVKEQRFNKDHFTYLTLSKNKEHVIEKKVTLMNYSKSFRRSVRRLIKGKQVDRNLLCTDLIGISMTQMSASRGIKLFGERAIIAMAKEYAQLDDLSVFTPRHVHDLTAEERKSALSVIDLIKEKRCGKIKGRTVVDGRGQRESYTKAETSSSALTLEAFIMSLSIDAYENRDVAVTDIAGAFLKAEQPDVVIIKMRGPAVEAILRVDEKKYRPFVTIERGISVLYMQLLKAMYGTLTAAILWYNLFADTLVGLGFKINPYDTCVANKDINGSQITICWYVDDLKISHKSKYEVDKILKILDEKFGSMSVTRGKRHTYLGMDFQIDNGEVSILMKDYLVECISAFGEVLNSNATTPANKSLMTVDENSKKLCEKQREVFHHIVQKLLHICKRGRLDLQVAIAFLCTRVRTPNQQDWAKLKRVLQYVRGTLDLPRVISLRNFGLMDIFVDASHASHDNMRGHTGGCVSVGKGVIHGRSSKQRINTRSSTETELVGVSDYLPYPIWMLYFLQHQGYFIDKTRLMQDNQSTMKILKNGKKSCGKQSRHINIRFFWIVDRSKEMDIDVEYCPTELMLADFFTKPLQGTLFRDMRDIVQGIKPYETLERKFKQNEKKKLDEQEKDDQEQKSILRDSIDRKERVVEIMKLGNTKKVSFDDQISSKQIVRTYADAVKNRNIYGKHTCDNNCKCEIE